MAPHPTVWTPLEVARAEHADRWAAMDGGQRVTYATLGVQADGLARGFLQRGLQPGDRVAALLRNGHAYLVTYFGVAGAGGVVAALNHRLREAELAYILADAGVRWLVADADFAPTVSGLLEGGVSLDGLLWVGGDPGLSGPPESHRFADWLAAAPEPFTPVPRSSEDVAQLYYTSGTTGRPKGVMLTHENVCVHARGAIDELSLGPADVWGHIAPMFHLADAWATFAITWVGGCHVLVARSDAETVLEALTTHGVTVTNLIPTMLNDLVAHPATPAADLSRLRLMLSGGAPIAPTLVARVLDRLGCDYVQTYGMTETSPYLTLSRLHPHLQRLPPAEQLVYKAKTGRPFATVELRVVDEQGRAVEPDGRQVGEIQVRGRSVTPGYWNRPEATAAAFTADGFLRTGDLAVVDDEGYVDIVDRLKDMIITGGENVYSTEVENALYAHPAVHEAAVVGVPDPRWGEAVVAVVVLRADGAATPEDLLAHCRERLAGFKVPKRIVLRDALPRTGSGKIRKQTLRDEL